MCENSYLFINKKILVYGVGKTGVSVFNFLKRFNKIYLFDDNKKNFDKKNLKTRILSHHIIQKSKFDIIILSPGIDINKCKLKKFLKKNSIKHFPAIGDATLCGVIVDCNVKTGLANNIESYICGGQLKNT